MIERYTLPEIGKLWSEIQKKQFWLDVEFAAIKAKEELGLIPKGIYKLTKEIKVTQKILNRADELEKTSDHDLMAFVHAIVEILPDKVKPHFHTGLTSYDVEDTALALQMVDSVNMLEEKVVALIKTLKRRALEHKETYMIGRTHGIHAEPTTFGLKLLDWVRALEEHLDRLINLREIVGVGKLSGAVGTHALPPEVEQLTCEALGIQPVTISTQIIGRDIHTYYMSVLVGIATSVDRFAVQIRLMSQTEIREVREFARPGAKGSSAMPGKSRLKNPIKTENVCGLSNTVKGYLFSALGVEASWYERSLDNSAPERIHLPDASTLVDFMLFRFNVTMEKLIVHKERMEENIHLTKGIIFAQSVMIALTEKGMAREEAYALLEELAFKVNPQTFLTDDGGRSFKDLVYEDEFIDSLLSTEELDQLFDHTNKVKYINEVYERFDFSQVKPKKKEK